MSILNWGYHDDLPEIIKYRVIPTNLVSLIIIFCVGIPFLVLTPIYLAPSLTLIPCLGTITCLVVLCLNRFGMVKYSRIALSLVPVTTGFSYNLMLCGPTDEPIPSVYLITLGFALVPFVTLDIREWKPLLLISIYSSFLVIGFPLTRSWATMEGVDVQILRSGWLGTLTLSLGVMMTLGCMYGLSMIGRNMHQKSQSLQLAAEEDNKKLIAQQAENEKKTKTLEENREEEKRRQWVDQGVSDVLDLLRHGDGSESIYDTILSKVVKYVGANQGGLFIVNNDQESPTIELQACYAYERKKYLTKTIQPGEGLLGQAYLEQAPVHLSAVPEDYIRITSGLGHALPKNLIIVPMVNNDKVAGLIEIASLSCYEDYHINFISRVAEAIGGFTISARTMEQTRILLEKSQHQTEELRATEEEMRQSMEELQATQEEMERRIREQSDAAQQREKELLTRLDKYEPRTMLDN